VLERAIGDLGTSTIGEMDRVKLIPVG